MAISFREGVNNLAMSDACVIKFMKYLTKKYWHK